MRSCQRAGAATKLVQPRMHTDTRKQIRTTISQNLRTPRKFFLVVLVLVLVLDWVSGLDYEDEGDSVAAAPLRVNPISRHHARAYFFSMAWPIFLSGSMLRRSPTSAIFSGLMSPT